MTQQQLDWHTLTHDDVITYMGFYQLCRRNKIEEFSSDTFRNYGLDKDMKDKQHDVGTLFAKWKWHRLIIEVGRTRSKIESNHKRRINLYKFKTPEDTP